MRPRKRDRHLPARVYLRHGAYYYVVSGKWRRLGSDLQVALAEYARIISLSSDTMPHLIDRAMPSIVRNVTEATATQYRYVARLLAEGFAEFSPAEVRASDVIRMLDAYADRPATAHRLLVVLKAVFGWALERDEVGSNPCIGVKRPAPMKRDRLMTAGEFAAIYAEAPERLRCVMDLCRLTGQRIGDVLAIQRSQLEQTGIRIKQQKTGTELVVAWTPELRAAVERAKALSGDVASLYLFAGRAGKPVIYRIVWRQFSAAAKRANVSDVRPHDLRALAATEAHAQGLDATALLGQKSARTTELYLRDKTPKTAMPPSYKRESIGQEAVSIGQRKRKS